MSQWLTFLSIPRAFISVPFSGLFYTCKTNKPHIPYILKSQLAFVMWSNCRVQTLHCMISKMFKRSFLHNWKKYWNMIAWTRLRLFWNWIVALWQYFMNTDYVTKFSFSKILLLLINIVLIYSWAELEFKFNVLFIIK